MIIEILIIGVVFCFCLTDILCNKFLGFPTLIPQIWLGRILFITGMSSLFNILIWCYTKSKLLQGKNPPPKKLEEK